MKKVILLLLATALSLSIDAQTNALAMETKLFLTAVTPIQAFIVTSTSAPVYPYLPAPVYDERTSWGKCMNAQIRACASMWSCGILCGSSVVAANGCLAGFAASCAIFGRVVVILPKKSL